MILWSQQWFWRLDPQWFRNILLWVYKAFTELVLGFIPQRLARRHQTLGTNLGSRTHSNPHAFAATKKSSPSPKQNKPGSHMNACCPSLPLRSRGSTGRTKTNPMGDASCRSTRLGNLLCARTLILLWVLAAKGCSWVLEQPSSSLMEFHVLFQRFLRSIRVRRLSIQMADYGSPTLKPTYLYSSHLEVELCQRFNFYVLFGIGQPNYHQE